MLRKRVLFVESAPAFGGSFVVIRDLLRALDRVRFEPIVLFYHDNGLVPELLKTGIKVIVLNRSNVSGVPWRRRRRKTALQARLKAIPPVRGIVRLARFLSLLTRFQLPMAIRLRRIIGEERADLVHLNGEPVFNREGILACHLARVHCVCHVHQYGNPNLFDRIISGRVDFAIYNSRAVQLHFQRQVKFMRDRVIYNGLHLNGPIYGEEANNIKQELGLEPNQFVVLGVGRITEWKGQHILLSALAQARPKIPNLVCLLVGAPTSEVEFEYQKRLQDLRDSLGLSSVVRFLGHRSDVERILAAGNVLAHTSTSPEPFGLVIIEGMAASLPVIATNAGGVPEIIDDGETGLLVPSGDPNYLANALITLASNTLLARQIGLAGRVSVQKRFTLERMAREVEEVWESVLA